MPGVPDTYQGTELLEFTLVDPDNRRPVDYDLRRRLLDELRTASKGDLAGLARELGETLDSRAKLYVIWRVLQARNRHPGLFSVGEYYPIRAQGPLAGNVFAFARRHLGRCALVAVPRLVTKLHPRDGAYSGPVAWADTQLIWPGVRCSGLTSILDGRPASQEGRIALADLFATLPVAVLVSE
jgi:(1->4)-alpha-D-glucan 1-alpha-D-glucosylmutase